MPLTMVAVPCSSNDLTVGRGYVDDAFIQAARCASEVDDDEGDGGDDCVFDNDALNTLWQDFGLTTPCSRGRRRANVFTKSKPFCVWQDGLCPASPQGLHPAPAGQPVRKPAQLKVYTLLPCTH